jgi:hypothetical protein
LRLSRAFLTARVISFRGEGHDTMTDPLENLLEKDRIIDVINRLFIGTDRRDWQAVKECFADRVLFDMTSMAGGEPVTMTPQQIVDGWEEGLREVKAIHHQAGNYLVTVMGDEALAFCYGVALHHLTGEARGTTRRFVGSYDLYLTREGDSWRINRFRFNLKFIDET